MAGRERLAEERQRPSTLMWNSAEAGAGRVAVDDEIDVEVRELQHRCSREGMLEGVECCGRLLCPSEALLAEKLC